MTTSPNLAVLLASTIVISLTGVMMPGPVTAVTVTKGSRHKEAGALIALGHGLVEVPLIVLISLGSAHFLELSEVKTFVGLAGGLVLMWMAWRMFRIKPLAFDEGKEMRHGSVIAGLATTAANPYFFVWWATVGATLVTDARAFGATGVLALGVTHWLCDLAWLLFVSWAVFKSKALWTQRIHRVVFGICGTILAGFGAWFIFYGIDMATCEELIAWAHTVEDIRRTIGADSLGYLSTGGLARALGVSADDFCWACLTGDYPIPVPDHIRDAKMQLHTDSCGSLEEPDNTLEPVRVMAALDEDGTG